MRWPSAPSIIVLACSLFLFSVYLLHSRQIVSATWSTFSPAADRCPSPYVQRRIDTQGLAAPECLPLGLNKSASTRFSAQICTTLQSTCNAFEVVIKRKTCKDQTNGILSSSPEEERYMREQLGSDTFHIAITGTELYATAKPTSYSQCTYRYVIPLSNAGAWKIQLWHIYEAYDGLAEIYEDPGVQYSFSLGKPYSGELVNGKIPRWPRNLDTPLLNGGFDGVSSTSLNLPTSIACPLYCAQYAFTPSASYTRTRNADGSLSSIEPHSGFQLPLCPDTGVIPGAYLPDPTPLHQLETAPATQYKWQPIGCRLREDVDLLLSNPDEINEGDRQKRRQCLMRKASFLMQGDSHLRMTYDALVTRLKGDTEAPIYYKSKRKDHAIEQLRLTFAWDPFLETIGQEEADYVLVSAGAHHASEHYLTNTFLGAFRTFIADMLVWQQKSRTKLLYLTSPSRPPRGLPNGFSGRDWRTNPRMQSWGNQTQEMLRESGLESSVIQGYETSLPFYKYTSDSAHFHGTAVMEGWLMQIVHSLNLCAIE